MFARFRCAGFTTLRLQMAPIKTFAFIDLETTGLPLWEHNKTKITELTILAVQSDHLELGVMPRVQNKLTLCFNPRKLVNVDSERITGLSNSALEHLSPFSDSTVAAINGFLQHSPAPICLVAHNGNRFDYPILRTEIHQTGHNLLEGILCVDSLDAFREIEVIPTEPLNSPALVVPLEFQDDFDELLCKAVDDYEVQKGIKRVLEVQKVNETTPQKSQLSDATLGEVLVDKELKSSVDHGSNSKKLKSFNSRKKLGFKVSYKLVDVYERLTNKVAVDAHQAENDVNMMALSAATLGEKFVDWANEHSRMFLDIPMMVPGRKIGT